MSRRCNLFVMHKCSMCDKIGSVEAQVMSIKIAQFAFIITSENRQPYSRASTTCALAGGFLR